jgi:hypothetical protein
MNNNAGPKTISVLCDSNLLFFIIKANLQQPHWRISRYEATACGRPATADRSSRKTASGSHTETPTPGSQTQFGNQTKNGKADLIIIAHSDCTGEPVVALARAGLTGHIGHTPLLIVSERPFEPSPDQQIFHLDFPFDTVALRYTVQNLLAQERPTNAEVRPM